MKTAAVGINNTSVENEPDLELDAESMVVVRNWLQMALRDVTAQLSQMKPPAIASQQAKAQVAVTMIGVKFLRTWIDQNISMIDNALEIAGVEIELISADPRPAEGELN